MEQLRLYTGGHKFHNEDFTHLQTGVIKELSNIIDGLTDSKQLTILKGVEITDAGGSWTWTEGFVKWLDNFYFIPAQTTAVTLADKSFQITEIPEANNPVTYRDGQQRDVHIKTELTLLNDLTGEFGAIALLDERTISSFLRDNLINNDNLAGVLADTGWTSSGIVFASGWTNSARPVQYRKQGGRVEWRGTAVYSGSSSNPVIFDDISSSYRPTINVFCPVGVNDSSERIASIVVSSGAGSPLAVAGWSPAGGLQQVSLDGIFYYIDI